MGQPVCFGFIGKRQVKDNPETDLLFLLGQIVGAAGWHLYAKRKGDANTIVHLGYKDQSKIRPVESAEPFRADPLVVYCDDELRKLLTKMRPGWQDEPQVVVVTDIDMLSKVVSATQLYASGAIGGSRVDGGDGSGERPPPSPLPNE